MRTGKMNGIIGGMLNYRESRIGSRNRAVLRDREKWPSVCLPKSFVVLRILFSEQIAFFFVT